MPLFSEETSVQKRFFSPENREFEQDYRFFHSPKEESLELLGKATIALPIKMNVKFLKKRPLTSGSFNRKGYKTIETPINYKIRNNFICTPMKGIYKGENEDYWEDEFRTISVFGEGAKIYK